MLFLDPVKFKRLKFSNHETMRMSKGKALTGVNQPGRAFPDGVRGWDIWVTSVGPFYLSLPLTPCQQKEACTLVPEPDLLTSEGHE